MDPLRISTRHFPPYMHQDSNGNFYNGMEFQLLQRMAKMLNRSLQFQTTSDHFDICNNVTMNVTDICIGGIFPTEDILNYSLMSVTYESDDLTWCVQKAEMMPMFLSLMLAATSGAWTLFIFGYIYPCGFLLYLLIQFDLKYKRRNFCNWHHTTGLLVLPAVIGISPNFQPVKGTVRIFFAFVLVTAFFFFQIIFTRTYELIHRRIPWHQVSSFNEIMENDFSFIGSLEAFNLLKENKMIPHHRIESFNICDDIGDCLVQLSSQKKLVIGGSRQNILNSPMYSNLEVFCFEGLENIASYPVALYMRKDFYLKDKLNEIVGALSEVGFLAEWKKGYQFKRIEEMPYTIPLYRQLSISNISANLVFTVGGGSLLGILTLVAEIIISWKMKQQRWGRRNIWKYLEEFFDGDRHYFKNLPDRLQKQRRHSENENCFPFLE